ncbi:MAG: ADP-ribosylglycohydrolase family protein [Mucilaginibacter polytrichastri]|nr:ADP-ribosylglycohydrolase family protein [Mucilaginibacter polytrichastri]
MIRSFFSALVLSVLFPACHSTSPGAAGEVKIPLAVLKDKIKGGWAGQTIGVTFGGPTEFRYNGTFIQDYQSIDWHKGYVKTTMENSPDLYDDIYMDITFVDILEKHGFDAPVDSFAQAFAHAGYNLWHANQAARYNLLNGISAPASGHWKNNPHADDIDFQIEADFSGLMSPGMPDAAIRIGDRIGHIMNYGDGWYGGVFMAAMYSEAFVSTDIPGIIRTALGTIPEKSLFHQCISDVLQWHRENPRDWKANWMNIQRKWAEDIGCPEGVFAPFDIDAKLNAAYVVLGLLYGGGDMTRTLEIATRAGQDSDCNPSSAGGVLGTVLGYNKIPAKWKEGLAGAEDIPFKYTDYSFNRLYETSYRHALKMIADNGGKIAGNMAVIKRHKPPTVRFEQSFAKMFPTEKVPFSQDISAQRTAVFAFNGSGFVLRGAAEKTGAGLPEYIFEADVFIDGKKQESPKFPTDFRMRRYDLCWAYALSSGRHEVKIVVRNPDPRYRLQTWDYLVYRDK